MIQEPHPSEKSPMVDGYWLPIRDGDPRGRAIYNRHYSSYKYKDRRPKRFVGPGEHMCLMTVNCNALFVWRKFMRPSRDGQAGVCCSVFRNESTILSSTLILEAMELANQRWPGERLFTYVDPTQIRSTNPGYCFKIAGWTPCGVSKRKKLVILEYIWKGQTNDPKSPSTTNLHRDKDL